MECIAYMELEMTRPIFSHLRLFIPQARGLDPLDGCHESALGDRLVDILRLTGFVRPGRNSDVSKLDQRWLCCPSHIARECLVATVWIWSRRLD
ncbi:hypothetical protein BJX63DRAFT_141587 [Aspergillus granulosus]|uniref:Uncharacterized protein n=1 Tax=Aspergillus granulosus TaxID=176169 RepID=A0ABR4HLP3_9EURO